MVGFQRSFLPNAYVVANFWFNMPFPAIEEDSPLLDITKSEISPLHYYLMSVQTSVSDPNYKNSVGRLSVV